ncbi:hypothetical protein PCANC_05491 [Puccinia coronata f. sp. avenae]|uniref:RNA-binding protein 26 n=1 Tax=Puccinia coronata f. sp. avenae TaxID=200324 RepID=A0A2N5T6L4_9BASI|nr:hypothetical protein PCANC_05491 [Puccinia coronata f. sp. avenae]
MRIEGSQADALRQWMVHKLKPICDADHEVLSEYVMALLRHDQAENELRSSCLKQLEDFLQQDTKLFVTDLFDHLRAHGAFHGSYQPPEINLSASVLLRKRSLAPDEPYLLASHNPPLNSLDNQSHAPQSSTAPIPQYTPTQSHPSFLHFPEPTSNLNLNPLPNFPPSQIQPYNPFSDQSRCAKRPRRSMCRDYHYRGYCARGSSCQFSHDDGDRDPSSSSIYLPKPSADDTEPNLQPQPGACIPVVFTASSLGQQIPALVAPLPILPTSSFSPNPPQQPGIDPSHHYNSRHTDRSSRFDVSPSTSLKKSSATLIIENIPQSSLSDQAVRDYFSIFGPLTSVSVDIYNAQAQVTFKVYEDAKRAYSSPEPVFNNRFVRIHFKRFAATGPRRSYGPLRTGASPSAAAESFGHHESTQETHSNGYRHKPPDSSTTLKSPAAAASPPQSKLDVQVLSQREQELRLKIDAQKRMLEQLSQKKAQKANGTSHNAESISPSQAAQDTENQSKEAHAQAEPHITDPIESTPELTQHSSPERRLSFTKEATSPLPDSNPFHKRSSTTGSHTSYVASRGGRKLTNSRTSWTPAGAAPIKAFKLDNRSCTLAVHDVPSAIARENLKIYMEQFGPLVSFAPLSDDDNVFDVCVKFASRASAEKALANGLEIADVGRVKMTWVPITAGSTGSTGGYHTGEFIPGIRPAPHPVYPRNLTLVNHHPSPAAHNGDQKDSGTAPNSARVDHQIQMDHIDHLVDDFSVDEEVDGCWKR